MSKKLGEKREERPLKLFGLLLPSLPYLTLRFGGTFLRFKRDAKKAGKIFRKELIKQGVDKQVASELTGIYIEGSNISNIIRNMS